MGEIDPGLKGGNTLPPAEIRFGLASHVFPYELCEEIDEGIDAARKCFDRNADTSEKYVSIRRDCSVVEGKNAVHNNDAYIIGQPAVVDYESKWIGTTHGKPEHGGQQYHHTEEFGSVLTVIFHPDDIEKRQFFRFDFDADDPVEEVAQLGQAVEIDGRLLTPREGAELALQVIGEAAQSIDTIDSD